MSDTPKSAAEWAAYLKTNWDRRSHSEERDYYIAPQGYGDESSWDAQGRHLAESVLTEIPREWLREQELLEIGCGVGRLAKTWIPLTKTFTGVDISPGMIEEAKRRCPSDDSGKIRFIESDGLRVPDAARDRQYGVIMTIAVFVHCPVDVIASILRDAYQLLAPGGIYRIQVLADADDGEGIVIPEVAEVGRQETEVARNSVTEVQSDLIDEHYMGHAFEYAELQEFLTGLFPDAKIHLLRFEFSCIYASIHKPDFSAMQ